MSNSDLPELLLLAIRRKDVGQATLLIQRWVHRGGLQSLQAFQSGELLDQEGPEACCWLQALITPSVPMEGAPQPQVQRIELISGQPQETGETRTQPSELLEQRELPLAAPLPASLADLRAWLSDPGQGLSRAS